jgi:hypothetical protein
MSDVKMRLTFPRAYVTDHKLFSDLSGESIVRFDVL